jgi:hypothetical protein
MPTFTPGEWGSSFVFRPIETDPIRTKLRVQCNAQIILPVSAMSDNLWRLSS